jgi:hypothetical protein
MEQLQLSVLGDDVACGIIQLLVYQPVSYGSEQDRIRLPYFSSTSTIKRTLELQEQFPNKALKISSCEHENDYTKQTALPHSHDLLYKIVHIVVSCLWIRLCLWMKITLTFSIQAGTRSVI